MFIQTRVFLSRYPCRSRKHHLVVRGRLFLAELTGTKSGISCEVQLVDIFLRFVLTLLLRFYHEQRTQTEFQKETHQIRGLSCLAQTQDEGSSWDTSMILTQIGLHSVALKQERMLPWRFILCRFLNPAMLCSVSHHSDPCVYVAIFIRLHQQFTNGSQAL